MYDEEADRNPSPPTINSSDSTEDANQILPESSSDNIGQTVFSQHWLFQQITEVLKYLDRNSDPSSQYENEVDDDEPVELEKAIEESMCLLWDMSAEFEVSNFLVEFKAREIFMGILIKTNAPRLQEIILGILANMASHKEICNHFGEDTHFITTILQTLASVDSPSLIQTLRLVNACIVNESCGATWIEHIQNEECEEMLNFILSNSLNDELLKLTLKLLYECMDQNQDFIIKYAKDSFIAAVLAASDQLICSKAFVFLDEFWFLVQLMTTCSVSFQSLIKFQKKFSIAAKQYLLDFSVERVMPGPDRLPALAAALAFVNALVENSAPTTTYSCSDFEDLKDSSLMDFLNNMNEQLKKTCELDNNETSETLNQIQNLLLNLNRS